MNIDQTNLSAEQRTIAIQRLSALWAFTESGLGGIMHALQMPFTGLIVGAMSIIMISFIAQLSADRYKEILKSLLIVLIIKAMVSPYTPFPAYIAVAFQGLMGFALFKLLRVNPVSILLLSIITMLESAIQQLLILTLFFGQSIWAATDAFVAAIAKQFDIRAINGSKWIITVYLLIYILGAVATSWLAWKTLTAFATSKINELGTDEIFKNEIPLETVRRKKNTTLKIWVITSLLIICSVIMYFIAADAKQGWIAVAKTVSWTLSAIVLWYMLINPIFTKLIKKLLQKNRGRYSEEVSGILSFLPVLRQLTAMAWRKSKLQKAGGRWHVFLTELIRSSLTYNDQQAKPAAGATFKKTA